jgi:NADH-quinone oxidoreductase subunit N
MYMREPLPGAKVAVPMRSGYVVVALVACAVLVVLFGILPGPPMNIVGQAMVRG